MTILPLLRGLSLVGRQSRCRGKQTRFGHVGITVPVLASSVAVTLTASFAAIAPGLPPLKSSAFSAGKGPAFPILEPCPLGFALFLPHPQ